MKLPDCILPAAVPAPETPIAYEDGTFGPLMFHFATEGCNAKNIALENGFEFSWILMLDAEAEDTPCVLAYDAGDMPKTVALWSPSVPDGWTICGVTDSEDGPCALLLRRIEQEPMARAAA
jgi:hypothetical protein